MLAWLSPWHERVAGAPRRAHLVAALEALGGSARSLLDVGSGDGRLGRAVAAAIGAEWSGVDVDPPLSAPGVRAFDGVRLPFADESFELVLLCDVLHHAKDPLGLLREALRVCQRAVLLKDHFSFGPASDALLSVLDAAGNAPHGRPARGRYFSPDELHTLISSAGGALEALRWPLRVHAWPLFVLTRDEHQFAARLVRSAP